MSVWTLQQINQARGIRAKAHVDVTQVARGGEGVWDCARSKMFRNMLEIARTFALELDPRDLQFSKEERVFDVVVVSWWEPQSRAIELRGGRMDGEQMEYRDAPKPIRMPRPPRPPAMFDPAEDPTALIETADTYVCTGWHERDRRWVYEVQP